MSDAAYKSPPAFTTAELAVRHLTDLGASVFMTVPPSGHPFLSFDFGMLPPAPDACSTASLIRHRFNTDERFRKDLFGWLLVEGRVHQLFAERHPGRVVLEMPSQTQAVPR